MRKIVFISLLLFVSAASFAQPAEPISSPVKEDYLKKSKNQKTAAWIFLGGGFACATTGLILGINGIADEIVDFFTGETSKTYEIGAYLFYTGLTSMAVSVPLFLSSASNKRKAGNISTSFKFETGSFAGKTSLVKTGYPAIALKIHF